MENTLTTTIFIGGSRRLSKLTADVKRRIDNIVEAGFRIVVGDANGADKAVQRYLAQMHYSNMTVFCMFGACRNNVGQWPIREIDAPQDTRGFAFYVLKDIAMANEATHGLMLWDGISRGTLNNVLNFLRQQKPVVVYVAPQKAFVNVRTAADVKELLGYCDPSSVERFKKELDVHHALNGSESFCQSESVVSDDSRSTGDSLDASNPQRNPH